MDRITDYLETNIKLAYKSVTFHFKRFVWFYIALFIVQTLLGVVSMSMNINSLNIKKTVQDNYRSHYVFYYMNTNQKLYLERAARYYFKSDYFFDITDVKEYGKPTESDYKCDVYVTFADDAAEGYKKFEDKYLPGLLELGEVYSAPTPLFDLEDSIQKNEWTYKLYLIIISVCSFLLLNILYNIRSNNYRFDYGVYMAFGADKKKLLNTSFWEMTIIAFLTFIPAVITSGAFTYITAKLNSAPFNINLPSCLRVIALTLLINTLSILFVITKTALKTPISLISSGDNSNLVHSPRASSDLLKKPSLSKIASLGFFRYYKYYTVLIISGVLFSALFVCGLYCTQLYTNNAETQKPQFEVSFNGNATYSEDDRQYFTSFNGITDTVKEESTYILELNELILVKKENALLTANTVVYDKQQVALDNVKYYAADTEVLDRISRTEKTTGDLYSILDTEKTVVISDSYSNGTHYKFKPGDKIMLGDYYTKIYEPDYMLQGRERLKEKLRAIFYKYEEYTVAAVIHDNCSDENLKIYMNHSDYTKVTGKQVKYDSVRLFTDENLSFKETNKLYSDILKLNRLQYKSGNGSINVFVRNTYANVYKKLAVDTHFEFKLIIASYTILLVSGLVWFFSQTLFYAKRQNEFTVMRSVGYTMKQVQKIIFKDAMSITLLSSLTYLVMSYLLCYGIFRLVNSWLFLYSFRYSYDVPVIAVLIGLICTIAFSVLSTVIPYWIYKKNAKNTVPEV